VVTVRQGALAGLLAGIALTFCQAALRLAGISLIAELVADRVLPHLPVDQFLHLLGLMGGAQAAKQQALVGGFFGTVAAGVALGGVYALAIRRQAIARHPARALGIAVVVAWGVTLVLLWPVLPASYIGLPPAFATAVTGLGLLAEYAAYAVVLHGRPTCSGCSRRRTRAADRCSSERRAPSSRCPRRDSRPGCTGAALWATTG
jgi:hypothetical protein